MGAMADLGVHKTDLIQYLIGQTVEEVEAQLCTLDKKFFRRQPHHGGRQRLLHLSHGRRRGRHDDRFVDELWPGG